MRVVAVLCAGLWLLGGWPGDRAAASCAGPVLSLAPVRGEGASSDRPALEPGRAFEVFGEFFYSGCDDTGQGSGCGSPRSTQAPLRDVELVLEQGSTSVRLGTASAGARQQGYPIHWDAIVPSSMQPGPAVLRAASGQLPVELR